MVNERYLRLAEVLRIVPVSRATLYRWHRTGRFPQAVKIGPATTAWLESELLAWVARRAGERPVR